VRWQQPVWLREIPRSLATQRLPVIVLTSSPDPHNEIELLEAGADDYPLKPVVVDRMESRAAESPGMN
jgi:DNA-binding response OmpR family regulator